MSNARRSLPVVAASPSPRNDGLSEALREATSHEIVFAVVSHVGAGASWVARALTEGMGTYSYEPVLVKMSGLIEDAVGKIDPGRAKELAAAAPGSIERTQLLQSAGNWLRETHGPTFTAALAIKRLHAERLQRADSPGRVAYIIDSLKNPFEIDALRKLYGRSLYVVSVICGKDFRFDRLRTKYKGAKDDQIHALMKRDEAEEASTGQHVRKTLLEGDFYVNNEETSSKEASLLAHAISRFLQIVFSSDVVRPTRDERGMYAAWTAGLRSACLSRQVGAAILDVRGQLVATGTNDVPRFGGGLYEEDETGGAEDNRCARYFDRTKGETRGFCRNDAVKKEILEKAIEVLQKAEVLRDGTPKERIIAALTGTPLSDLVEFSRAVHAEMDAIVSLARSGSASTEDGTLYCTTYPCHSCARHIVAAGIRDVVYIEPYLKSRAATLHDDAIVESTRARPPEKTATKVHFRLFNGVAPRRYAMLFQKRQELKDKGELSLRPEPDALHIDPIFTKSHLEFEQIIARHVDQVTSGTPSDGPAGEHG